MKAFTKLVGLLLVGLLFSQYAFAGSVEKTLIVQMILRSNGGVLIEIQPVTYQNPAPCALSSIMFYLPPSGPNTPDTVKYSALLAAELTNKRVTLFGEGNCDPNEPNFEIISSKKRLNDQVVMFNI